MRRSASRTSILGKAWLKERRRQAHAMVFMGCIVVGLGLSICEGAPNVKCFEGQVTYCGINADGGAISRPGSKKYAGGMNWACQDQLSNLDPTYIAPNCHDKESCEALQTSDIDDPYDVEHASPYTYVADKAFISAARSLNKTATESCPPEHPACGLQTTLREAKGKTCEQCYTRFRYTADIGAIYWRVFQIKKECIPPEQVCHNNTGCWCTTEKPFYKGGEVDPTSGRIKSGTEDAKFCSPWAKAACRRKVFKCMHFPADYVMTTFQDYDIKFCSLGSDEKECSGCVACTDDRCQQPVIHVSKLVTGANLLDSSSYNCSVEKCGEAPRTCWHWNVSDNKTCAYSDDCWPMCDASVYQQMIPGAKMGFYVGREEKLVERVKCCNTHFCNFPNAGARPAPFPFLLSALIALAVALRAVHRQ